MKRGCVLSLLILGACFGGYWYVLRGNGKAVTRS